MDYHPRLLEPILVRLFEHYPVVAVLGARQTGKSTLVRQLFGDRVRSVVFDPVEDVGQARQDADLFLQNNPAPRFLDEIQHAPELLAALKRRVDRSGRAGQYILSGSQNLSVLRQITESLAGRVAILELFPMCHRELTRSPRRPSLLQTWVASRGEGIDVPSVDLPPSWHQAIWRGGYPGLLGLPDDLVQRHHRSYVQTYIERDVRTVAGVGDLQAFGRFFALLAAATGQEVNAAQLGRDLGMDRKTAVAWKSTASATYQWVEVPAFTRNATKRVSGKQKGYMTDTGLVCFHQRIASAEGIAGHPLQGPLVETWVVTEILKEIQAWSIAPALYHYRSHGGAEVDLILEIDGWLYPVEIKSKSHPVRRDAVGLQSFRESFPRERIAPGLIVCAIEEPTWIARHTLAVPWWSL